MINRSRHVTSNQEEDHRQSLALLRYNSSRTHTPLLDIEKYPGAVTPGYLGTLTTKPAYHQLPP